MDKACATMHLVRVGLLCDSHPTRPKCVARLPSVFGPHAQRPQVLCAIQPYCATSLCCAIRVCLETL